MIDHSTNKHRPFYNMTMSFDGDKLILFYKEDFFSLDLDDYTETAVSASSESLELIEISSDEKMLIRERSSNYSFLNSSYQFVQYRNFPISDDGSSLRVAQVSKSYHDDRMIFNNKYIYDF